MEDYSSVMEQISRAERAPEEGDLVGATPEQIRLAEALLGFDLPDPLVGWLSCCNGTTAGPGGIYGVFTRLKSLDICEVSSLYPTWRSREWIPVAGDGCGNCFVLLSVNGQHPVAFIDASLDSEEIAFAVASSLKRFLKGYLDADANKDRSWPFAKESVLKVDPDLEGLSSILRLPWESVSF